MTAASHPSDGTTPAASEFRLGIYQEVALPLGTERDTWDRKRCCGCGHALLTEIRAGTLHH